MTKTWDFKDLSNQEFFAAIADNDAHVYNNMTNEYNFIYLCDRKCN
ncbi:MAG: hypothetical protein V7K41_22780 [Nostoc sp.]